MQVEGTHPLIHHDAPEVPAPNLELFRLIVDQGPDAVVFANPEGKIHIWNNAAAELFGYLRKEAIGQSLDIIIPDRLRQAHWEGFGTAMASGYTKLGKTCHKDQGNP
jgi:PAS domain S-box-containing protein